MKPERYFLLASICLLILALSSQRAPEHKDLGDISSKNIGEKVTISGSVKDFRRTSQNTFFTLSDETGEIKVAIFSEETYLSGGETVTVTGTITLYHGKIEVIADSVSRGGVS